MVVQTGLVSIATANLARLQAFYEALLGISPAVMMTNVYVEFRVPGLRLGLYTSHNPDFVARLGATSICLQVTSLDPILALAVIAEQSISKIRHDFHGREFDVVDPDGNRVVIHEPSSQFWDRLGYSAASVESQLN